MKDEIDMSDFEIEKTCMNCGGCGYDGPHYCQHCGGEGFTIEKSPYRHGVCNPYGGQ